MPEAPPILKVGLTGGIAAGKSTVAAMLAESGACVVDADRLTHEVTAPGGTAYDDVVARFGNGILNPDESIDRARLARLVFADDDARKALERIVHPKVRIEAARRFETAAAQWECRVAVFDAALLVETGAYRDFQRLIVVRCSREMQIRRLTERDGLTQAEAESRLAAQAPLENKLAVADYVIDTDTALDETRSRTAVVYESLLNDFDAEFGRRTRD